jgi:hypothetical protein
MIPNYFKFYFKLLIQFREPYETLSLTNEISGASAGSILISKS